MAAGVIQDDPQFAPPYAMYRTPKGHLWGHGRRWYGAADAHFTLLRAILAPSVGVAPHPKPYLGLKSLNYNAEGTLH